MAGSQIYGVTEAISQGGRTAMQTQELVQAEMQRVRSATDSTVATMSGRACQALITAHEKYQADMRALCAGVSHHGTGLNTTGVDYENVDHEAAQGFQRANAISTALRA